MTDPLADRMARWQRNAWIAGLIGCACWIAGTVFARQTAFQGYWFAWIFWSGIGFGALSIVMTQFLSGGAWGAAVRPAMQAAALTIPLMGVMMIPVFFFMGDIFPWAGAHALAEDMPHKRSYLTVPWFIVRAAGYFLILSVLARLLQARGHIPNSSPAGPASAAGILIYAGCMLFAGTDWVASLSPHWFSTMLVVIVMAWQFLAALALAVIVVASLARAGFPVTTKQLHDLGNLLLAFVIFWTYVSFGEFLIIWSGNLPREISWYLPRSAGGWQYLAVALATLQFALPFFLLLSRARKQAPHRLLPVAVLIFTTSILEAFWLIMPSLRPLGFRLSWLDVAAFMALGGVWLGTFLRFSEGRLYEPKFISKEAAHD